MVLLLKSDAVQLLALITTEFVQILQKIEWKKGTGVSIHIVLMKCVQ
jgi:hypothetical protein